MKNPTQMKPKVSILIPLYKTEKYIEKCLCSVFQQTYDNIEYILADDASPDESISIAKQIAKSHNREKYVTILRNTTNRGIAYTRNLLINHANGDYIYFVDGDDFIERNAIEIFVKNATTECADIVRCTYYQYSNGESLIVHRSHPTNDGDFLGQCLSNVYGMQSLCFLFIRRDLFMNNQLIFPNNINGCEDFLMTVKLFYYANKIHDINTPLYYYRLDNNYSITHQNHSFHTNALRAVEEIESFLKEKGLDLKYKNEILKLKFTNKQHFLINKKLRNIKKYTYTFPESNSCYRQFNFSKKQKLFFYLAEQKCTIALRLIFKLSDFIADILQDSKQQ